MVSEIGPPQKSGPRRDITFPFVTMVKMANCPTWPTWPTYFKITKVVVLPHHNFLGCLKRYEKFQ